MDTEHFEVRPTWQPLQARWICPGGNGLLEASMGLLVQHLYSGMCWHCLSCRVPILPCALQWLLYPCWVTSLEFCPLHQQSSGSSVLVSALSRRHWHWHLIRAAARHYAQQSCCPDRVQGGCYQYWLAMSAGSSTRQQRCACDLPTGDIAHAVYGYRRHTCSDTHTHPAVLHHVLHITRLCNARALCSAERNFDLQWQPLLQQVCAERSPPAIGLDKYVILPAFQ